MAKLAASEAAGRIVDRAEIFGAVASSVISLSSDSIAKVAASGSLTGRARFNACQQWDGLARYNTNGTLDGTFDGDGIRTSFPGRIYGLATRATATSWPQASTCRAPRAISSASFV